MMVSLRFSHFFSFISLVIGFGLFLKGFMPNKSGLPGLATTTTKLNVNSSLGNGSFLSHRRLLIMVIDAWRSDFILGDKAYMNYTSGLIKRKESVAIKVKSHPPTVTLPRIKALTSGSIPGFIDVVLNFDSSELKEDNLLAQFKTSGKKLIFFGDDTWIRLFPNVFERYDGTTSFYVSDFTEVDNNVTRHLDVELENEDWDVMILHYLGLDHIGHLSGPYSPYIGPKLQEMDHIVERIHQKMLAKSAGGFGDSMLIVCGDHGMTDQGGHGGSSVNEVTVPAVFISTRFNHLQGSIIEQDLHAQQIDITPSIALLFGLPIPQNNLGMLIPELFTETSVGELVKLYEENAKQLWRTLEWNFPDLKNDRISELYEEVVQSVGQWVSAKDQSNSLTNWERKGKRIVTEFQNVMRKMQEKVASSLANYDLYAMAIGVLLIWLVLINSILQLRLVFHGFHHLCLYSIPGPIIITVIFIPVVGHVTICTSNWRSVLLCGTDSSSIFLQGLFFVFVCFLLCLILNSVQQLQQQQSSSPLPEKQIFNSRSCCELVLLGGSLVHSISLMSSSFIEEEHQTWYFSLTTFHIMALFQFLSSRVFIKSDRKTGAVSKDDCSETFTSHYYDKQRIVQTDDYNDCDNTKQISSLHSSLKTEHKLPSSSSTNSTTREKRHYSTPGYYVLRIWNSDRKDAAAYLGILTIGRICRSWNQTGNKWLGQLDIGDWLVRSDNIYILSCLVGISIAGMCSFKRQGLARLLFPPGLILVYCYRAANGSLWLPHTFTVALSEKGILEARLVYTLVLIGVLEAICRGVSGGCLEKIHTYWVIIMSLLLRPHNIILTALLFVQEKLIYRYLLSHLKLSATALTLYFCWLWQATFYYQGNSNSVSTVDVSAGYIGIAGYQPLFIGTLMVFSTYAGLIFWFIALIKNLHLKRSLLYMELSCMTILLSRCVPLSLFTVLVSVQRYHLFVWTVFSPKLLYEGSALLLALAFTTFIYLCGFEIKSEHI